MINYKNYIPLALLVLLLVLSFLILEPFLKALFLGALLAYIFYPLHIRLKAKVGGTASATLICLLVLLILVIPAVFFLKTLIFESYALFVLVKQKLAVGLFTQCQHQLCGMIKEFGQLPEISYQIQNIVKTITTSIVDKGSALLVSIPRIILNLVVMFFTLFYLILEGPLWLAKLNKFFNAQKKEYNRVVQRLKDTTYGIIYGYGIVALIQGILGGLGFWIFGLSSPFFWGLVMGLLALVPFLGTGLVWVPAALILFLDGLFQNSSWLMIKAGVFFVYCLLLVSTLDNIIRPKIIGEKARIHPVMVMLGIFGGILFFGAIGIIIGPLLLSFTAEIAEIYLKEKA
ncbi:MAG TPA: AI-2E family transporter [Candidatus Nanoarchaeia archaeon]|nr:AI-2E family transporter [Candidatus Nanoarchaeia archaeon]